MSGEIHPRGELLRGNGDGQQAAELSVSRTGSRRRDRALLYLQCGLLVIGLSLLAVFLAFHLYGMVGSRVAVWQINSQASQGSGDQKGATLTAVQDVDFGLWSLRRIEAYKKSLAAKFGSPTALLTIARLSLEVPVFDGAEEPVISRGVGRIVGTARPGEAGNVGIAGHRDGFFRCLKDIQIGDRIELKTPDHQYAYAVDEIRIVRPEDVSVLRPRSRPSLTLVTCYPFYWVGSAPQRFIVHASTVDSDLEPGEKKVPGAQVRTNHQPTNNQQEGMR